MKKFLMIILLLIPISFLLSGWFVVTTNTITEEISSDSAIEINETELLVQYLEANGDFINTPNIEEAVSVTADEVYNHLGNKKYHIVDIREADDYYPAHIPGAAHVESTDLIDYMKSIPLHYIDKVVLVCYAGQKASYTTGLLRLLGHNKVYFMKWGMSAWTKSVAESNWMKNVSNRYASKLQAASSNLPEQADLPTLYTFKTTGKDILETRIADLMQEDYSQVKIKAEELMANSEGYFLIQYDPLLSEKAIGGIAGCLTLTPSKSLKIANDLKSIPSSESIVVTSLNGHTSGIAVAYLRTIGYDARFLTYGLSSLAANTIKEKGLEVFSAKNVKNFSTVSRKAPVVVKKPKKAAGGC